MNNDSVGGYPVNGEMYPGVTSILDYALGTPSYLMDWAVKKGVRKLLAAQKVSEKYIPIPKAIDIALSARQDILLLAQAKGTAVHAAIQQTLENLPVAPLGTDEQLEYFASFLRWQASHVLTPILQEKFVVSTRHKYAGRFDFYGEWNGQKILIDFKTSNSIKPEYGLQLAAYRQCLLEMGYPVEKMLVLYIREDISFFVEYTDTFESFLDVRHIFDWKFARHSPGWRARLSPEQVLLELEKVNVPTLTPTLKELVEAH